MLKNIYKNSDNLLLLALKTQYVPMIYLMLETIKKQTNKEIDINEKNKEGDSAIILLIKMKNLELFNMLIINFLLLII